MAKELLSESQQFSGLPMADLIGGPLNAVAKANALMSLVQTKFILDICYTRDEDVTWLEKVTYKPVMIIMSLEKRDPQVGTVVTKFDLPLVFLLPINSMGFNSVDLGLESEISSQTIPCPVCGIPIPYEINCMLSGEWVSCPQCEAKVSLPPASCPQLQEAIDKLEKLKMKE